MEENKTWYEELLRMKMQKKFPSLNILNISYFKIYFALSGLF